MTTLVTVKANGPCYPARLIKKEKDGSESTNVLIASGYSYELWVGTDQTISVTEEYHVNGYPAPVEAASDAAETKAA
jgi:hypothetical protein